MHTTSPLPIIDIRYGRFLAPFFNTHNHDHTLTEDEISANMIRQRSQWTAIESVVVGAIQEITQLTFIENLIPVYTVPNYDGAFSDPLVISSRQVERFADVLTHELIHRLGDYNQRHVRIRALGKKLYRDIRNATLRDHIFVHAVHKYVYLDVLDSPERLATDIQSSEDEYAEAWEIVEREGYIKVIEKFTNAPAA